MEASTNGTTPTSANWLAAHPDVSGLTDTGVFHDEGQHLQSVYPIAAVHGGPGKFALNPAARLTEHSPLNTPDSARRLLEAWTPFWDTSKLALVEKSPPNLIRMRFLRALFPASHFIMLLRHPVAVSMATVKGTDNTMESLLQHWLRGHASLAEDARRVGRVTIVRYEDVMTAPTGQLDRIFAFLSLRPYVGDWQIREGLNDAYFAKFGSAYRPWRRRHTAIARRYEQAVAYFGYSLVDPTRLTPPAPEIAALMPRPREARQAST